MKNIYKIDWLPYITLVILLGGTLFLIVEQVKGASTATKLENALFSILQFILSLGFAWILARIVSFSHFQETQKKFAIGAFRRIKEIERSLGRLQDYIDQFARNDTLNSDKVTVIRVSLLNCQDTVKSSIADWSDIIGDEIEVANEIERLKNIRGEIARPDKKDLKSISDKDIENQVDDLNAKIEQLYQNLPAELRISLQDEDMEVQLEDCLRKLINEFDKTGYITFEAFWEYDDNFMRKIDGMKEGDILFVAKGFTDQRDSTLLVYDNNNLTMGVILNECVEYEYDLFMRSMTIYFDQPLLPKYFRGNPINATIIKIKPAEKLIENERQYFYLRCDIPPSNKARMLI